ncbi:hypothetical protein LB540_26105, partial [Mesorhizobium sp. B261B1A]|nr:hypothetical protein [Mesorhizobium sp. B261B1A]
MGASALLNLLLESWLTPDKIRTVTLLFAVGGALAFPVGLFAARLVSLGRSWEVALFLCDAEFGRLHRRLVCLRAEGRSLP